MKIIFRGLLTACILLIAPAINAQDLTISLGPQLSTFGIGLAGDVKISDTFGVSAELNFLPMGNYDAEIDDVEYAFDPNFRSFILMANYFPGGGRFGLGAGVMLGGYGLKGEYSEPNGQIDIGGTNYPSAALGTLTGDFEIGGPSLALQLGWRSAGFNFGLGVFTFNSSASIDASGPLGSDPTFRADVDREIEMAKDDLEVIPVIPYLRIGYQFGI